MTNASASTTPAGQGRTTRPTECHPSPPPPKSCGGTTWSPEHSLASPITNLAEGRYCIGITNPETRLTQLHGFLQVPANDSKWTYACVTTRNGVALCFGAFDQHARSQDLPKIKFTITWSQHPRASMQRSTSPSQAMTGFPKRTCHEDSTALRTTRRRAHPRLQTTNLRLENDGRGRAPRPTSSHRHLLACHHTKGVMRAFHAAEARSEEAARKLVCVCVCL